MPHNMNHPVLYDRREAWASVCSDALLTSIRRRASSAIFTSTYLGNQLNQSLAQLTTGVWKY